MPEVEHALESRLVVHRAEGVEPVRDLTNEIADRLVSEIRDLGPGNAPPVRVHHRNVEPVGGARDRREAGTDVLHLGVAQACQGHRAGHATRRLSRFFIHGGEDPSIFRTASLPYINGDAVRDLRHRVRMFFESGS